MDFPGGSDGKASAYKVGHPGSIPGLGRSPGEGNGNLLQYSLPGESYGQKGVAAMIELKGEDVSRRGRLSPLIQCYQHQQRSQARG